MSKWKFLETLVEKNDKYIMNLEEQLVKLETWINNTYSIQKKEQIKIWMTEKLDKIESVLKKNESIIRQIEEIKKKIIYYKKL